MILSDLKIGQSGRVLGLTDAGLLAKRLLDMGFTPGAVVTLRALAPCGDPLLVELRSTTVILRRKEAACVLIAQASSL